MERDGRPARGGRSHFGRRCRRTSTRRCLGTRITPDWLLPALLKPAAKQLLDLLHDWPGIVPEDLRRLMGVSRARLYEIMAPPTGAGLIRRITIGGRRLALSGPWALPCWPAGTATSVGAARERWSVAPIRPGRCR